MQRFSMFLAFLLTFSSTSCEEKDSHQEDASDRVDATTILGVRNVPVEVTPWSYWCLQSESDPSIKATVDIIVERAKDAYEINSCEDATRWVTEARWWDEKTTINNVAPFLSFRDLNALTVHCEGPVDLSPLKASGLLNLRLVGCDMNDVAGLDDLKDILRLSLAKSSNASLEIVGQYTWLTQLFVSDTPVGSLSLLKDMKNLEYLGVWDVPVLDLPSLYSLGSLKVLSFVRTDFNQVSDLSGFPNLEDLQIGGGGLQSLEGFPVLKNLRKLSMTSNAISDVSPLANLTSLEELLLWDNEIETIASLSKLTKLTRLAIRMNPIKEKKCPIPQDVCEFPE